MKRENHIRRHYPRARTSSSARLFLRGRSIGPFLVENLSAGGALLTGQIVHLVGPLALGTSVRVQLRLPDGGPVEVSATVIRAVDGITSSADRFSFAVKFSDLSAETEDLIQSAVLRAIEESRTQREAGVLVLDECSEDRDALQRVLAGLGQRAFPADTLLDALRLLQDQRLRVEVALIDLLVRQASGPDVLAFLAEDFPDVRRVLMSRDANAPALHVARASGHAHAILIKPADSKELAVAIQLDDG